MKKKVAQRILLIVTLTFAIVWPQATLLAATDLPIGSPCKEHSDCRSNDCETSKKEDAKGDNLRFCDCNDAGDCQQQYGAPTKGVWECVDGASVTADLDYCINEAGNKIESTLPEYETDTSLMGRLHTALFDTKALQATLMQEVQTFKPGLEIRLPGLEFSDLSKTVDEEGFLHIPWIGEFLKAIYNFGLAIISIVAVVMIIMQGAKIIASGGESKIEGYKKIGQIAIGLMIAWGSYAILYTINPALVQFNNLKVKYIEPVPLAESYAAASEIGQSELSNIVGVIPQLSDGLFSVNLKVPPAANCADTCMKVKSGTRCADQSLRDMAYEAQTKTGYPAAVLLAQYMIEGPTFGLTCSGSFIPSEAGDQAAINSAGCDTTKCGAGFTWECTNKSKYLPPKAARDLKNGQTINCGKGDKATLGYVRVSGYRCFGKPVSSGNKFAPLVEYYERSKCFKEKKEKYGGDPIAFAKGVQACGYATAQTYADGLINAMSKYCFTSGAVGTGEVDIKTE